MRPPAVYTITRHTGTWDDDSAHVPPLFVGDIVRLAVHFEDDVDKEWRGFVKRLAERKLWFKHMYDGAEYSVHELVPETT